MTPSQFLFRVCVHQLWLSERSICIYIACTYKCTCTFVYIHVPVVHKYMYMCIYMYIYVHVDTVHAHTCTCTLIMHVHSERCVYNVCTRTKCMCITQSCKYVFTSRVADAWQYACTCTCMMCSIYFSDRAPFSTV